MLKLIKDGKIASAKVVDQSFAKEELRRITGMTDSQIGFVKGLIEDRAIGQLNADGTILLSDLATTSTVYHETFHRVWQGALTAQEREAAVRELKTNKNWKQLIEPYRAEYGNNEDVLIEEYFADEFANFVLGEPKPRTFLQKLFDQLAKMLKYITGAKPSEIERIYDMMNKGGYVSRPVTNAFQKSKSIKLEFKGQSIDVLYDDFAPVIELMHRNYIEGIMTGGNLSDILEGKKEMNEGVVVNKTLKEIEKQLGLTDYLEKRKSYNELTSFEKDKAWFYLALKNDLMQPDKSKSKILAKYKQHAELLSKQLSFVQVQENEDDVLDTDGQPLTKPADENKEVEETTPDGQSEGAAFDKASFEIDPNSRVKTAVRIILSAIENTNDTSRYGMTRSFNWVELSNFLNENLAGTLATDEAVFNKLEELSNNKTYGPAISKLIQVLGGKDGSNLKDAAMYNRIQFIVQYTNTRYNMLVTEYEGGYVKIIDSSKYARLQKSAAEMSTRLINSINEKGGVEEFFKIMKGFTTAKEVVGEKYVDAFGLRSFYDLLQNDEEKTRFRDQLKIINDAVVKEIGGDPAKKADLLKMFSNAAFNTFPIDKAAKIIADQILSTGVITESSMVTAGGERVYGIALNNYMTQMVNELNSAVEEINKTPNLSLSQKFNLLKAKLPHLESWGFTNSSWLKRMLQTGGKIRLNVNQGIQTKDKSVAQDLSEVEETTLFSTYINQLLNSSVTHYQAVKHSDRSVLYSVQLEIPKAAGKISKNLMIEDIGLKEFESSFKSFFADYLYEEAKSLAYRPSDIQYLSTALNEDSLFGAFVNYDNLVKDGRVVDKNSKEFKQELDKLYKGAMKHFENEHEYIKSSGIYRKVEVGGVSMPVGISNAIWNDVKKEVIEKYKFDPKTQQDQIYEEAIKVISRLYSVNTLAGNIEQSFIFTGDPKIYKNGADSFKRFNVWSSTGELSAHGKTISDFIINSENREGSMFYMNFKGKRELVSYSSIPNASNPDMIATKAFAEEDYYVPESQLNNYKERAKGSMKTMLLNLGYSEQEAENLSEIHAAKLKNAYKKTNWGDGQSYINLFQWRRTKIQWGQWSEAHQRLFEMEVRIFNGDYSAYTVPEGEDAYVYFNEFLGLAETMKGQYAGPYWKNKGKSGYAAKGVAKTSFYPMLPSQIMGTKLESIHRNLVENGIGVLGFGSARKVGQRIKTQNKKALDDSKKLGERKLVKGMKMAYTVNKGKAVANDNVKEDLDSHIQFMEAKYFKHQVAIANKEKGKVISSSQSYKLTISNLFNAGVPIDIKPELRESWYDMPHFKKRQVSRIYDLVSKYSDITANRIRESINFLEKEVGYLKEGEYSDIKKLVGELKRSLSERGAANNVLDVMDLFAEAEHKAIELLPNRFKIEPVLYSLVRNEVTKQKRNGNSVPQVSSIFFEEVDSKTPTLYKEVTDEKGGTEGRIYVSEDYQMYEGDKKYADIGMPFPTKWLNDFMELYGTRDIIELVKRVNKDIADGNFSKFDEQMLFIKGLRIPNQQLSSNDVFRVKRFFVPTNTAMVVVPPIIATKVGSDFDIDKLNMYLGHGILSGRGKNMKFLYLTKELVEKNLSDYTDRFLTLMEDSEFSDSNLLGIEKAKQVIERYREEINDLGESPQDLAKKAVFEKLQLNLMELEGKKSLFRKAEENELLEVELEIMTLEENFMNLMKPTDDTHWRIEAKSKLKEISEKGAKSARTTEEKAYYESLNPDKKVSIFDAYTAVTNVIKTRENIASKGGVGQVAVTITGNTVNQLYGYTIRLEVLDADGAVVQVRTIPFLPADKNSSFSTILNQDNEFISELLSGLLTSQVDAVKDPYAKVLGLVGETLNMATYLLQRGVPHMDIIYFFAQPAIRDYLKYKTIYDSVPYKERGLTNKIRNSLRQKYRINSFDTAYMEAMGKLMVLGKNENGKNVYKRPDVPQGIDDQKTFLKILREFKPEAQAYMLDLFMDLKSQTTKHRTFMSAVSLDTFKPKRREDWLERSDKIAKASVNTGLVEDTWKSSVDGPMSAFFDIYRQYNDMYKPFYILEKLDIPVFMTIDKSVGGYISAEKRKKFNKVVHEDFINYLVQNLDFFKGRRGRNILTGEIDKRSAAQLLEKIKGIKDNERFRIIKRLIPTLNAAVYDNKPINAIRRSDMGESLFMLNEYIEEMKDVAAGAKEFFLDLVAYNIYATGYSGGYLSLDSFLPVKPEMFEKETDGESKFSLAQKAINGFLSMPTAEKDKVFSDFKRKFYIANPWLLENLYKDQDDMEEQVHEAREKAKGLPVYFKSYNQKTKKMDVVEFSGRRRDFETTSGFGYKFYNTDLGGSIQIPSAARPKLTVEKETEIAPTPSAEPSAITTIVKPGATEFNKLPGKSATPTMTYAGIGSRQTPPEILQQMTEVAKELSDRYTLNTGKTFGNKEEGADAAFSKGTNKKNLFAPEKAGAKEIAIAKEIHPKPSALTEGGLKLMARNTNQIFGAKLDTPVDFVLFWANEGKGIRPEGGTGQAVEMARRKGIPTINMQDSNWRQQLDDVLSKPTAPSQPTAATTQPSVSLPNNIEKGKENALEDCNS
jgi:hypothetical protein